MSLQIFAVKEEMSFNRPQLRELSLNAFYQKSTCATEGAEKPINTIHRGLASQTVPVRDTGMIPTRCTAIHTSRLKCLCEDASATAVD
ncbi:unnamed protein product [Penicillium camemberti]|uniref:Str. FM013 n=1 Tax=Penicillium camemberti (strain FM 013) TaxID=1429867 RepID=A0A0G4PXF2_PENC3|nr:unnamed protein product [Penicillium camemberti]